MENNKLKELICNGVEYIGINNVSEVSIDLLIQIRQFLKEKSDEWYYKKFEKAYKYDKKLDEDLILKKITKKPYTDDGFKYYVDKDGYLISCELYNSDIDKKFKSKIRINADEYKKYYYLNEIDHFFTYCINNYLRGKEWSNSVEDGLKYIKEQIEICSIYKK